MDSRRLQAHPSGAEGLSMDDYLDRDALAALDLDPDTIDRLLRDSPLSGHNGRAVIEAERLPELLALLALKEGNT
jgi:hypothetical protein